MNKDITFSIVTPVYNNEKYIAETIESVLAQAGDFSVEYIIIDNNSTDMTGEIVKSYQKSLQSGLRPLNCNRLNIIYISEKDSGMYDAIQKGFSHASGDVFAWINSDDLYLNGCFKLIAKVFRKFPYLQWIKGITSYINKDSTLYSPGKCNLYSREWIRDGLYGPVLHFIQQDSVFWRKELWNSAGGVNIGYKLAGDYDLWRRFAEFTSLYSVSAYVSCFRKVANQKSEKLDEYWREIEEIEDIKLSNRKLIKKIKKYEINKKKNPEYRMFRSVFIHQFNLITVDSSGEIEIHVAKYEELQAFL